MYGVLFFCSILRSMFLYGVVCYSMVFCGVVCGNIGCYIVVECIQNVGS